jgi:hypothetical protein
MERNQWVQRQKEREVERMREDLSGIEVPESPVKTKDRLAFWKKPQKSPPIKAPSEDKASSDSFHVSDTQLGIEPGGGGIVPGIDAPISAVNAGERVGLSFALAVSSLLLTCVLESQDQVWRRADQSPDRPGDDSHRLASSGLVIAS